VRKDFPASNVAEFTAYARTNQTRMQFGSAGVGSMPYLACAMLNRAIGVDVTHVPYRGAGNFMQDLIAGRIDYVCPAAALAIPQIESNTVKAVAIFSKSRLPILPDLGSAHEQGLKDFEANLWYAFFLPEATPAPIVQRLHQAVAAAMLTPALQARLKELGYTVIEPGRQSPEYLKTFVESEIGKWAEVIKSAGVAVQ
jgi:tripartite-type tricarboxylate transporter receptor subunit TctC